MIVLIPWRKPAGGVRQLGQIAIVKLMFLGVEVPPEYRFFTGVIKYRPGQPRKKPKQGGGGASVVAMLCFNLKIATIFRTYRPESTDPVRDRSQSLFTPPPRAPHRDIGALRGLQRRASSVM
ncbi:hypothetical protein pipiens_001549 [Culex pipiens pipiens]|uniref:Uncharacterized protein n=1 Tax=Culex pipiens pipiens TaxID=38569 RepID=A0ABD1CM46_CULPP